MRYLTSSTGKKFLMALSGIVLFIFVVGHLLGNLQIFLGQESINRYALFLQGQQELLWIVRLSLLAMVAVHIWTSVSLTRANLAARPVLYKEKRYIKASYASRTMFMSGLIILAFIIFHLLHFTVLVIHPEYRNLLDAKGRHDVYGMMILGFSNPLIAGWYIGAIFLLCLHLSHGIYSALQSLGFHNETTRAWVSRWGAVSAWIIFAGYASIPLAVLTGVVHR